MSAGADDYLIKPVDPFAVQTRLVAAERVTVLHRQVADFRTQLEQANLELLGRSLTDPLTGLGNRRRMDEDLATHPRPRAARPAEPTRVALFDIDHFKLYNDHYGHLAGDEALRQVAHCLDTDRPGRRTRLPLRRRGVPPAPARLQPRKRGGSSRQNPPSRSQRSHPPQRTAHNTVHGDTQRWGSLPHTRLATDRRRGTSPGRRWPLPGQIRRPQQHPRDKRQPPPRTDPNPLIGPCASAGPKYLASTTRRPA